jgi:Putative zinc-finger
MECPARERGEAAVLLDYCARKLDPRSAAVVERHVAQCAACQDWIRAQQAVWAALGGWEAAPVSPDFDRKLYQRIEQEERPAPWGARFWPLRGLTLRPALSLALASVVLLAAVLIRPAPPQPVPLPQQAQVETLDADRLERTLDDVEMLRQLNVASSAAPQSM